MSSTFSSLTYSFHSASAGIKPSKPKKKRRSPLSVRLSPEQRKQLERDAVGMSLNAYVLSRLFDDGGGMASKRRREPSNRDKAIARALRRLSHAGLAAYLASQIVAKDEGRIRLSKQEEDDLRHAYREIHAIRRDLMTGLGLLAD